MQLLLAKLIYIAIKCLNNFKPYKRYLKYSRYIAKAGHDRLTDQEIANLSDIPANFSYKHKDLLLAQQLSEDKMTRLDSSQWSVIAAKLANILLASNQVSINTVANIGAQFDIISCFLSHKYPDIKFISLDFPQSLAELNKLLPQHPNWSFITGYPLEKLSQIKAGLVILSGTALLIRNPELRAYFARLSAHTNYIIISEPYYFPERKINIARPTLPESLDPRQSLVLLGGSYLHNYPAILNEYGYETALYTITGNSAKSPFYNLHIVAHEKRRTFPSEVNDSMRRLTLY
jgi:hypothetical protein